MNRKPRHDIGRTPSHQAVAPRAIARLKLTQAVAQQRKRDAALLGSAAYLPRHARPVSAVDTQA
ncbi:MAG TPA: hypothetical protein VFT75_18585 [Nocardioidaceae bacterium]|nr:hypothetical protein [Nocardioidaceae bacterium]